MKMHRLALLVGAGVMLAVEASSAEQSRSQRYREMEELWRLERLAQQMMPRSRNTPLRYLNISDEEVREVEAAVWTVISGTLVHIGPVVTGCPCEDGKACEDQVWIMAENLPVPRGLQVSRIGGHWLLGPVQRWWLQYEKIQAAKVGARNYDVLVETERNLLKQMPVCESASNGT